MNQNAGLQSSWKFSKQLAPRRQDSPRWNEGRYDPDRAERLSQRGGKKKDSPSQLRFAQCASSPPPASLREEQKAPLVSPWREAKGEHVFSFFPLSIWRRNKMIHWIWKQTDNQVKLVRSFCLGLIMSPLLSKLSNNSSFPIIGKVICSLCPPT